MDNGPHFKTYELAHFFFHSKTWYPFEIEWNYFVENHGKSICDTHFSFVSKAIKQWSKEPEHHIASTTTLINAITDTFHLWKQQTKIKNKSIKNINNKQNKSFYNIYINQITIPQSEIKKQILKFENITSYYHFKNINNKLYISVLTNKNLKNISYKNIFQKKINKNQKIGYNTPQTNNNLKKNI